jgi:hypothetical protein
MFDLDLFWQFNFAHIPMHHLMRLQPFWSSVLLQSSRLWRNASLGTEALRLPGRWRWLRLQASPWLVVSLAPVMLLWLCGDAQHQYRARYLMAFTRLNLLALYHLLEEITLDPTWLM